MPKLKCALFCLSFLLLPAAASAQSLTCNLLPLLCEQSARTPAQVPELDPNAAGAAGMLVLGATLLLTSRRRRTA